VYLFDLSSEDLLLFDRHHQVRAEPIVAFNRAIVAFNRATVASLSPIAAFFRAIVAFNRAIVAFNRAIVASLSPIAAFFRAIVAFWSASVAFWSASVAFWSASVAFWSAIVAFLSAFAPPLALNAPPSGQAVAYPDMVLMVRTRAAETLRDFGCGPNHVLHLRPHSVARPLLAGVLQVNSPPLALN
jgi:hypothetical protein